MAKESRRLRWERAVADALAACEQLQDLQQEYQEWRDNLPENLDSSAVAEKLDAVCDLDLDGVRDTIDEADSLELPQGFGRD